MSITDKPPVRISAILAACAACAALVMNAEGYVPKTAPDPIGIATACYGHTGPDVKVGVTYTPDECEGLLIKDLTVHGQGVAKCIYTDMPITTRGAFTSFAFNVGTAAFCKSTMARKANAGDLRGACAELSRWVYAGGKVMPGLVARRKAERAMCEADLK